MSLFAEQFKEMLETRFGRGLLRCLYILEKQVCTFSRASTTHRYILPSRSTMTIINDARCCLDGLSCLEAELAGPHVTPINGASAPPVIS